LGKGLTKKKCEALNSIAMKFISDKPATDEKKKEAGVAYYSCKTSFNRIILMLISQNGAF
jgi:hypothetical protein